MLKYIKAMVSVRSFDDRDAVEEVVVKSTESRGLAPIQQIQSRDSPIPSLFELPVVITDQSATSYRLPLYHSRPPWKTSRLPQSGRWVREGKDWGRRMVWVREMGLGKGEGYISSCIYPPSYIVYVQTETLNFTFARKAVL